MAHGAGHAPAPAPVHELRRPENVRPINESRRAELKPLIGEFTFHAKDFLSRVADDNVVGSVGKVAGDKVQEMLERAAQYRVGLYGYWSIIFEQSCAGYLYKQGGTEAELKGQTDQLREINRTLEKQLDAWAVATSPFETYDVDRLRKTGDDLLQTLKILGWHFLEGVKNAPKKDNPKANRDYGFNGAMLVAVTGMMEQIGARIIDLASGQTVPKVTPTHAMLELINRTGTKEQDRTLSDLNSKLSEATDTRAIYGSGPEKLREILEKRAEAADKHDEGKDLSPKELDDINRKFNLADREVTSFLNAIDRLYPKDQGIPVKLLQARSELKRISNELANPKLNDNERTDLKRQRSEAIATLVDVHTSYVQKVIQGADAEVRRANERVGNYRDTLEASMEHFEDDAAGYWKPFKEDFLKKVKTLAGTEMRNKLDGMLTGGDLQSSLEKWDKLRKPPYDAQKAKSLQELGLAVGKAVDSYLVGATLFESHPKLGDELRAKLLGLKLSVAKQLNDMFTAGVFG
jgi:hypothetical protein